jgi:hypothetical protein
LCDQGFPGFHEKRLDSEKYDTDNKCCQTTYD